MTPTIPNQVPRFDFSIYNQSNDTNARRTAAIRAPIATVRSLITACTGLDAGGSGRTLTDFIQEADSATVDRPDPFYRRVDLLWQRPSPVLPTLYCQDRVFRVNYNGPFHTGGGISFYGYCVVEPSWWPVLLPLHQTPIQVEYHTGVNRDLIVIVS